MDNYDKEGRSPLYLAVEKGYTDIVEMILSKYYKSPEVYTVLKMQYPSPLHFAAKDGRLHMVYMMDIHVVLMYGKVVMVKIGHK